MNDLNVLFLIGRVTSDAKLMEKDEKKFCSFSIAVDYSYEKNGTKEQGCHFFPLCIFDKYAENLSKYLTKGTLIQVTGSLKQNKWNKDDVTINGIGINVKKIQLLSSGSSKKENITEDIYDGENVDNCDNEVGFY